MSNTWSNDKIIDFINEVHLHHELWNVETGIYIDRNAKKDGWAVISEKFGVTSDEAYKKCGSLRTYAKNEEKKKIKSGCAGGKVKWFAFNAISFILTQDSPNTGLDSENATQAAQTSGTITEIDECNTLNKYIKLLYESPVAKNRIVIANLVLTGSEVTLVAGSDTSEDSMDSLENLKMSRIPSFIISEPADNSPSITRGIGRKTSQENEPKPLEVESQIPEEFFPRRNSDKGSCYSDDSLSNDSVSIGNQSPSSSSNTQSSHAFDNEIRNRSIDTYEKMQINQELTNACGTQNFQIFQNFKMNLDNSNVLCQIPPMNLHKNSGSFEFELSDVCSKLQSTDILEMVKKTISDQIPPKTCIRPEEVSDRLSLEFEGGIQIELKIIEKPKDSKGLKMRRISGDHLVYNQLCQQLISCMTVS